MERIFTVREHSKIAKYSSGSITLPVFNLIRECPVQPKPMLQLWRLRVNKPYNASLQMAKHSWCCSRSTSFAGL